MWRGFLEGKHALTSLSELCTGLDTPEAINAESEAIGVPVTPLLAACYGSRLDFVQWLLEHGADPNRMAAGFSPLRVAVQSRNESLIDIDIIRTLLDAGANVNEEPSSELTALNECVRLPRSERFTRIAQTLVDRGARAGSTRVYALPPWIVEYIDIRDDRRWLLRALGAVVCARVGTKDTRRLIMKNAK